jgi:ATP-dependent Clp protease ATP-binding subunit ClpA
MFERYTERARRVLFFARYEASQMGAMSIDTEHLLLGVVREGKGLTGRLFSRAGLSLESMRRAIEGRAVFHDRLSTSVEIPFSAAAKRVLQFGADEADRLQHNYIGTEHLLLGLLREERSVASTVLTEAGLSLTQVRGDIQELVAQHPPEVPASIARAEERFHDHPFSRSPIPLYLPSTLVHISLNRAPRGGEPRLSIGANHWLAVNASLRYMAARVQSVRDERVQLADPEMEALRLDVALLLPAGHPSEDSMETLVLAALEQQLSVTIVRTTSPDGDVVTVTPVPLV